MKKWIALFLSLALLMTVAGSFAETETDSTFEFTTTLSPNVLPDNAMDNIASDVSRALCTVCLVIDMVLWDTDNVVFDSDAFVNFLMNDSYIGSDGQFIVVSGFTTGKIISLFYDPATGEARYSITETELPDSTIAEVIKEAGDTNLTYNYLNDKDTIIQVVQILQEAMENNT